MLEVIEDLDFKYEGEKLEWQTEARVWRLPYWDWAQPRHNLEDAGIPELFKSQSINIRVPKAADGSLPPAEPTSSPLWRYQLLVDGKVRPMGSLESPYTINAVPVDTKKTHWFPVRRTPTGLLESSLILVI
jgi:hypothetical protein